MSNVLNNGNNERGVSLKGEYSKPSGQDEPQETPTAISDIEEGIGACGLHGFHPVYIGDIYNERYEILRKIGYGQYSTVWLVKDLTLGVENEQQYKALKFLRADCYNEEGRSIFEREILTYLREADKTHPGYQSICHLEDNFVKNGPYGSHVCLVFELMGETLSTFRVWFKDQLLPNVLMRKFTSELLKALDYAHDNGVIHTDIKSANIFVGFRDRSLIAKFLQKVPAVQQDRNSEIYSPLRSQSLRRFYFALDDPPINMNIFLGDWGVASWATKHLCEVIQPVALRSPEVLIGAPWDWTTDWWNLGSVILEVFRGVQMFTGNRYGPHTLKYHFGPFPSSLLDQGDPQIVREMFNEDGTIKDSEPLTHIPALVSDFYMEDLPQEDREDFLAFLRALMKIDPKERLPTQDLFDHV